MIITGPRFRSAEKIKIFEALVASGRLPAKQDVVIFFREYGPLPNQPRLPFSVADAFAKLLEPTHGRGNRKRETTIEKFLSELAAVNDARQLISGGTKSGEAWKIARARYRVAIDVKALQDLHLRIKNGTVVPPRLVLLALKALSSA